MYQKCRTRFQTNFKVLFGLGAVRIGKQKP